MCKSRPMYASESKSLSLLSHQKLNHSPVCKWQLVEEELDSYFTACYVQLTKVPVLVVSLLIGVFILLEFVVMDKLREFGKKNVVILTFIPGIIFAHWGWLKMQDNDLFVEPGKQKPIPIFEISHRVIQWLKNDTSSSDLPPELAIQKSK